MSDEEDTNPAAPIPLWIEQAVERAMGKSLLRIEEGCASREARILESERRIIAALDALGVARLQLAQKATEASVRALRDDVDSLMAWRRDTERCPPPSEGADA